MSRSSSDYFGSQWLLVAAAVYGAMAVGIGAMGAHMLPKQLAAQGFDEAEIVKKVEQCETATRYQLVHAVAVLALALSPITARHKILRYIGNGMLIGNLLFSGGLYSMVFANQIIHWSIVPIGGMIMIGAWIALATWGANYQNSRAAFTASGIDN